MESLHCPNRAPKVEVDVSEPCELQHAPTVGDVFIKRSVTSSVCPSLGESYLMHILESYPLNTI